MSVYAEMVKASMCSLCSLNIPPNLVRMMRQLELNANISDRTILETLVYFFIREYLKKVKICNHCTFTEL